MILSNTSERRQQIATPVCEGDRQDASRQQTLIALVGIILLGSALRLFDLGSESFWVDEAKTVVTVQTSLPEVLNIGERGAPKFYYLIAYGWTQFFGVSETGLRSLSALFSIANLALMYVVGRKLFGTRVGILSALLMALSEFQVWHAQDARYYSLLVFLTLFSFLFLIRALEHGSSLSYGLYVITSALMYYTHAHAIFVIAAQNAYVVLRLRRRKAVLLRWVVSQIALLLLITPSLLPEVLRTLRAGDEGQLGWLHLPPWWAPIETTLRFVFPARYGRSIISLAVTIGAGVAVLVVGTWRFDAGIRAPAAPRQRRRYDELLLTACWFAGPILLPFILSFLIGPMYTHRYTISASPALYLLVAIGLLHLRKVVPLSVSLLTLVVLITPGFYQYYTQDVKHQWAEVATFIERRERPGDVIVFAPAHGEGVARAFNIYYDGTISQCGIGSQEIEIIAIAVAGCVGDSQRFWLIVYNDELPGMEGRFTDFFLRTPHPNMQIAATEQFTDISVYLFRMTG